MATTLLESDGIPQENIRPASGTRWVTDQGSPEKSGQAEPDRSAYSNLWFQDKHFTAFVKEAIPATPTAGSTRRTIPSSENESFDMMVVSSRKYSNEYIARQTRDFIRRLQNELLEWETVGVRNGIAHVVTMKELVEEYLPYLSQRTENRIFITIIELLLENHAWEKITEDQLKSLRKALERYAAKNLEWGGLEILHKELHQLQLHILITHESEPEEETEENGGEVAD